jgi:hypothetical protein
VASATEFRPTRLLGRLASADVDFVVVGAVAVVLQAQPRFTKDLDICYATTPANLDRLGQVLVALHARLRGIDEDLPFVPDARMLRGTQILALETDEGGLDLLVSPSGCPPYDELRAHADVMDLDGTTIRVASIADMLAMKRAAGRPQDLVDIDALEVARRRRGRRRG